MRSPEHWGQTIGTRRSRRAPDQSHYQFQPSRLEHHHEQTPVPDLRAARAAHGLYRNRQLLERVLDRIDRASAVLQTSLALTGQTSAVFGLYEVILAEENQLHLTRHPEIDSRQLSLPEASSELSMSMALAELAPEQVAIIERAEAGELPCPHCATPLVGKPFRALDEITVRLSCPSDWCRFEEI